MSAPGYLVPLDWRIEIAPGAAPDGDPSFWKWEDVGAYRRQSADIELNTGRGDESDEVEAADSNFTIDLRDGLLSARNPNSRLYGQIGSNTPIRYRLPKIIVDSFTRTASNGWGATDTGQTWSGSGSSYSVTGGVGKVSLAAAGNTAGTHITGAGKPVAQDLDIYFTASIDTIPNTGSWVVAPYVRYQDSKNFYRLYVEFRADGTVSVKVTSTAAGVYQEWGESLATGTTYTVGQKIWVHAQAIGPYLRIKVWNGAKSAEPFFFQVNSQVGVSRGGGFGLFHWRNAMSNAGNVTVSIDDLQVDAFLWSGNVPEFPPRWDKSGEDATATLVAAGPLRRFNQGNPQVKSPLTRQLPIYAPTGYWPLEDDAGSTSIASGIPGGIPGVVMGDFTFAADSESVPGTKTMAQTGSTPGMSVSGQGVGSTGAGFAGLGFFKLPSLPPSSNTLISWRSAGTVVEWRVVCDNIGMWVEGYNSTGTQVVNSITTIYPSGIPLGPFSVQLETAQSGSNIQYTLLANAVGDTDFYVMADGTVAGTAGSGKSWALLGGAGLYGMSVGQIWLGPNTLPYVNTKFLLVSSGYKGELATDRLNRLFTEQGKVLGLVAGAGEPMGAQPSGKFLDLVNDCATTDGGILYETGTTLAYLPRVARYNPPVSLVLNWGNGDLAEAPEPTDDDQRLKNVFTVSRTGGSQATAQDDDSIAKHGAVEGTLDVNNDSDDRLIYFAQWYAKLGSIDEMRWPVIELDLIAHPEFIPAVLSMLPGSRIQIVNPKDQVAGLSIDLVVEGIKQTVGRYRWHVTLACSPASPWLVGVYGSTNNRYDSRYATLAEDLTTTETGADITSTKLHGLFSTAALPYDVLIEGERCSVTAATAPAGSGPYTQTLTLTRSVNGVTKTQAAGKRVRIATPGRYAL